MIRSTTAVASSLVRRTATTTTPRAVTATTTSLSRQPLQPLADHHQQRRWNYQVFLGRQFDRSKGIWRYDDWEYLAGGFKEPEKSGQSLLQLHLRQDEHIKPTERGRRINAAKKYRRSRKHVEDLTAYIQFVYKGGNEGSSDEKKKE